MANIKISELDALALPDATDLVPVTDNSASQTKRTTVGGIVDIINGDVDVANNGTATISELPVSKLQDGDARQLLQTNAAGTGVEWTSDVDVPGTLDVTGVATFDNNIALAGAVVFEGSTADDFETTLAVTDPTADRTITLPNVSGTVVTTGDTGTVTSAMLANGTIVDADVSATAEIAVSKLANGTANQVIVTDGTNVSWSSDLTLAGDLTVNGTTTTINTETLVVEDKNIELGKVTTPTDLTADGGGITLKGTTDKTINWVNATDSWTSSEHVDLASGKSYRINNTEVLTSTTLGNGVTTSSLTSVGTISSGTWEGTVIDSAYLDSTVVTTSDTGTVTSAMIADNTIVDGDVSTSAAIAGTKIAPDFGSQAIQTTGDLVINTDALVVDSSQSRTGVGTSTPQSVFEISKSTGDDLLITDPVNYGTSPGTNPASRTTYGIAWKGDVNTGFGSVTNIQETCYIKSVLEDLTVGNSSIQGRYGLTFGTASAGNAAVDKVRLDYAGRLLIGYTANSGGALLQVNGDKIRVATSKTPASASDTGVAGEICWDADYVYVCTATDTWKRAALSTW